MSDFIEYFSYSIVIQEEAAKPLAASQIALAA
jgi:hypothetical protein